MPAVETCYTSYRERERYTFLRWRLLLARSRLHENNVLD